MSLFGQGLADPPTDDHNSDINQSEPTGALSSIFGGFFPRTSSIGQDDIMSGAMPGTSSVATGQPTMSDALAGTPAPEAAMGVDDVDVDVEVDPGLEDVSRDDSPALIGGNNLFDEADATGDVDMVEGDAPGADGEDEEEQDHIGIGPDISDEPATTSTYIKKTTVSKRRASVPATSKSRLSVGAQAKRRRRRTAIDMLRAETNEIVPGGLTRSGRGVSSPRKAKVAASAPGIMANSKKLSDFAPQSPAQSTPKAAGRGRPKKSTAATPADATPKKRGRPSKLETEARAASSPMKRGRPSKAETEARDASGPKKRGRPAKTATAVTPAKKRGRPAGSAAVKATTAAPKRRGRPPKDASATEEAKPKRGRPAGKTPKATASSAASTAPKKRGRPAKVTTTTTDEKNAKAADEAEAVEQPVAAPKQRKGRAAKAEPAAEPSPTRKRGRAAESEVETEAVAPPRKRGRAAKKEAPVEINGDHTGDAVGDESQAKPAKRGRGAKKSEPEAVPETDAPDTEAKPAKKGRGSKKTVEKADAEIAETPTRSVRSRASTNGNVASEELEPTEKASTSKAKAGRSTKTKATSKTPLSTRSTRSRG